MSKKELYARLEVFRPGAAVRLSENVLHPQYRGLYGRVLRTVKRRGMVTVELHNGQRYDAWPDNVELLTEQNN